MKKVLLLSAAFVALSVMDVQAAQERVYGSVKIGASFSQDKADDAKEDFSHVLTDFAVGMKISDCVRAEAAFAYRGESDKTETAAAGYASYSEKDTVSAWTLGVNAYYDIKTGTKLTPYVTAGAGLAKMSFDIDVKAFDGVNYAALSETYSKVSFSWNVGAGVSYELNDRLALDVGYRYTDFGSFKKDDVKFKGKANEVTAGVRFLF